MINNSSPIHMKNLISTDILNWEDFNILLKNHPRQSIVVIDKDGKKTTGLSEEMSLEEKNLIFIHNKTFEYDLECVISSNVSHLSWFWHSRTKKNE